MEPSNKNAELYEFGSGEWTKIEDYPFGSWSSVSDYEMVYIPEILSYFVIGGYRTTSQIAGLTNGEWFDAGNLKTARAVSFCSFLFDSQLICMRHTAPSGSIMFWLWQAALTKN